MREKGSNRLVPCPDYMMKAFKLPKQAPRVSVESLQTCMAWRCLNGTQHFCWLILVVSGHSLDSNGPVIETTANRVLKRNALRNITITGESVTADEGAAKIFPEEQAKIIEDGDYSADQGQVPYADTEDRQATSYLLEASRHDTLSYYSHQSTVRRYETRANRRHSATPVFTFVVRFSRVVIPHLLDSPSLTCLESRINSHRADRSHCCKRSHTV
ncbi:hypothetical protein TNCV_3795601 [Trichonephila clavipes]|nr:hypothetical protein TNCV_3795601 [Trichonephila clavipes]